MKLKKHNERRFMGKDESEEAAPQAASAPASAKRMPGSSAGSGGTRGSGSDAGNGAPSRGAAGAAGQRKRPRPPSRLGKGCAAEAAEARPPLRKATAAPSASQGTDSGTSSAGIEATAAASGSPTAGTAAQSTQAALAAAAMGAGPGACFAAPPERLHAAAQLPSELLPLLLPGRGPAVSGCEGSLGALLPGSAELGLPGSGPLNSLPPLDRLLSYGGAFSLPSPVLWSPLQQAQQAQQQARALQARLSRTGMRACTFSLQPSGDSWDSEAQTAGAGTTVSGGPASLLPQTSSPLSSGPAPPQPFNLPRVPRAGAAGSGGGSGGGGAAGVRPPELEAGLIKQVLCPITQARAGASPLLAAACSGERHLPCPQHARDVLRVRPTPSMAGTHAGAGGRR